MASKRDKIFTHSKNIAMIILGCIIMGSSYNLFYRQNNILLGGFSGIAAVISYLLEKVNIYLSISVVYFLMNIIIFVFAAKVLGKVFAFYTVIGIVAYSLFLEVCQFPTASNDLLLSSIYGGVIDGFGIGLIVRFGGSTGGGDMLGCVINFKKPKISVGWVTIIVNAFVIILSIIVYGINLSLYALIAVLLAGKTADIITEGPKSIRAFYIISSKSDKICYQLIKQLDRGVTSFEAYGKYTGKHLEVILCLVNAHQVHSLKNIVTEIDSKAFLFSVSVKEALGEGFLKLNPVKTVSKLKNKKSAILKLKSTKFVLYNLSSTTLIKTKLFTNKKN